MPVIWCSISGHGYGHAAQVVPILNELGRRIPALQVILRTDLPQIFFQDHLRPHWQLVPGQQDVGCVQQGPLIIDVKQTWEEYKRFHRDWTAKVANEAETIRSFHPNLVLSNISHFGIEAGSYSGIPTVGVGWLSWDQVLEYFRNEESDDYQEIIQHIRRAYQRAQLMIRLAPGIPMVAFPNCVDVGPIAGHAWNTSGCLREQLNLQPDEKLVLVAFGGIPLTSLPLDRLETFHGFRFLIGGPMDLAQNSRIVSINQLSIPFGQILAEADIVMTKPGYATIIDVVRNKTPVIYVRRYNFVDEQLLVDYAHHYGQAVELSRDAFYNGDWREALEMVQQHPNVSVMPPKLGISEAADVIETFL